MLSLLRLMKLRTMHIPAREHQRSLRVDGIYNDDTKPMRHSWLQSIHFCLKHCSLSIAQKGLKNPVSCLTQHGTSLPCRLLIDTRPKKNKTTPPPTAHTRTLNRTSMPQHTYSTSCTTHCQYTACGVIYKRLHACMQ